MADFDHQHDFVQATIQEVLARVDLADANEACSGFESDPMAPAGACTGGSEGSGGARQQQTLSGRATGAASRTASGAGASASGRLDTSMLELPGNSEATIRLLKARVRALEEQMQVAVDGAAGRDAALAESQREVRALQQDKAAAAKAHKALEAQVERYKRAAQSAREAQAAQEAALKEREREEAKAGSSRKLAEQESRAREVRLARALEEVERHKALLQEVKAQERDGRDVAKTDYQRLAADHAKLERQKNTLLAAFRKQLRLIDVLRRQKAHLEAARCLAFTEEEFMRALETGQ
ncbi:Testis [Monoraphidium neglectum]|uniref:Testis n=1 Tax=Monoraphidium neglectum TaxID=145388 RepID=A0A0D2KPK0_9CHLO|nr:Testis [Monoraphidium neglectum]KIY97543.1 Testis [Monoraphidium neglectum]|eukprot:XP_013896563.1 Testis [Monoraphidium neglectum]